MDDNKKDKSKKISYIFTRETMGVTLLLFCAIVLVMLLTGKYVFAGIGTAVCTFMYGTFGYGSYLVVAALTYLGVWLTFEKKIKFPFWKTFTVALTVVMLFLLFHAVSTRNYALNGYGKYIKDCYMNAQNGYAGYTFGGVISALIVYPFAKLSPVAAYVIFSLLVLGCTYLTLLSFGIGAFWRKNKPAAESAEVTADEPALAENEVVSEAAPAVYAAPEQQQPLQYVQPEQPQPVEDDRFSEKNLGRKILFEKGEFDAESYRRNMIFNENSYFNQANANVASEADYLSSFTVGGVKPQTSSVPENSYSQSYSQEVFNQPAQSAPSNYVYGETPATELNGYEQVESGVYSAPSEESSSSQYGMYEEQIVEDDYEQDYTASEPAIAPYQDEQLLREEPEAVEEEQQPYVPPMRDRSRTGFGETPATEQSESGFNRVNREQTPAENNENDIDRIFGSSARTERMGGRRSNSELFDSDDDEEQTPASNEVLGRRGEPRETVRRNSTESSESVVARRPERTQTPAPQTEEQPAEEKPKHVWKRYVRPSLELLDDYPENNNVNTGEIEDSKRIIVETLERFKIACEVSNVTIGPAITRYDVIIADKTKINQSLKYRDAIAMGLKKDNLNAYLNYSKGALSIEVPNNSRTTVGLKTMLASPKFINCKPNSLTFGLGKNVEGEVVCPDITKMPHLLVAGTTGSGKSICLSSLLISLLYKYGPEELRLILVDPKQVEFISYDKLPHLMINEIIYECDKAIKALNWAIKEMERRYSLFKDMTEAGTATKNLDEYNAHLAEGEEKLPKILIVLDEFGDLMLQAKKDIESRIIKLVQKARACGIHLILATQRPSVDCITGLIKSNLPTRIGFKVNSFDDARTIFDIGGAEKLLGRGDMYFRSADNPDLARIQGCFVDTHEVQKVTDFIKAHNETYFDQSVSDFINRVEQDEAPASMGAGDGGDEEEFKIDDTHIQALRYCVTSNQASVSMIQRRFPVGYIKACKIIDWMEKMNYITPSEGSKPRKVLLSKEEFISIYGDDVDD